MCRSCYRGHCYCSVTCRIAGYLQNHREAQKQYRKTQKGKDQHILSEKKRRVRKKIVNKLSIIVKQTCMCLSMTIQSLYKNNRLKNSGEITCCDKCGKQGVIVDKFPIRGYGKPKKEKYQPISKKVKRRGSFFAGFSGLSGV